MLLRINHFVSRQGGIHTDGARPDYVDEKTVGYANNPAGCPRLPYFNKLKTSKLVGGEKTGAAHKKMLKMKDEPTMSMIPKCRATECQAEN